MSTAGAAHTLVESIWDELVAGLGVGMVLHDGRGAVRAANRRAADLLGVRHCDLLNGLRPDGWQICDDSGAPLPAIAELSAQVLRGGCPATGPVVITVNGVPHRSLWAEVYPVPLGGSQLMVTVLHPVQTDLRRSKGLLDPLTELPNRPLLFDRLEQALTRARTRGTMATVVLADLRGLCDINRKWGFEQGDHLLVMISRRLRAGLREDHTVARYSGGTFAVVADHPGGNGEAIADRTRTIAERGVSIGQDLVHPSVRTSWATSDGGSTVHELICLAESRLRPP